MKTVQAARRFKLWHIAVVFAVSLTAVVLFARFGSTPLRTAPERDPIASDLSNLKGAWLGAVEYAADSDDHLPHAGRWMDETYPYVRSWSRYRCVDLRGATREAFGHSFNDRLSGVNANTVTAPESTVLIFDSTLLAKNAHSGLETIPRPPRTVAGAKVFYLDGHPGRMPSR